ncbi:phosphoglycerate mutase-like protein [Tuber magnatum]|uniref:3-phytase n=1 Tax=Tuber magnatum TaxID=42249 RepID=A0A317SYW6_9PEZI|nr:phosphoglycerate mutase-like protein [Tuber magnatum]
MNVNFRQAVISPRRFKYLLIQMSLLLFSISAMICLLASVVFLLNPQPGYSLPNPLQQVLPAYLQTNHHSWGLEPAYQGASNCPDQKGEWNILYHLGGNGPWVEKVDGVVKGGILVPDGCEIDMAHMMSRHGERFPTKNAGARMIALLKKIKSSGVELKGSLAFLDDWQYFTDSPEKHFEQLTTTGPYSGTLEAFTTGVKLRTRYRHLWEKVLNRHTLFWTSESDRVIDTARYFGAGFFGLESKRAELQIISEDESKAGDTLTPGDTCKNYVEDPELGHDYGYEMLYKYRATYLPAIAQRLEEENPGLQFSDSEIYSMQEMCGFEITVRGNSKWCDVFTKKEWSQFEYARDIIHYYRAGPGNKYGKAMGWLWLNTTANLIAEGPESAGPLYFSFVHDGDIVPMLAAFGIFEDTQDLPIDEIMEDREWKTSQITPMGGRIIFERLSCAPKSESAEKEIFVRFNVNDGIVPLEGCTGGPGKSCPLNGFLEHVERRGEIAGDFRTVCGLAHDAPDRPTFLRQPSPDSIAAAKGREGKDDKPKKLRFWGI